MTGRSDAERRPEGRAPDQEHDAGGVEYPYIDPEPLPPAEDLDADADDVLGLLDREHDNSREPDIESDSPAP